MPSSTLLSEHNPLLKEIRRATSKGSLTEDGFAVCEGFHLLEEALRSGCELRAVIAAESVEEKLAEHAPAHALDGIRVSTVADRTLARLASTETSPGVISLVKARAWTLDDVFGKAPALVVALDAVQDPGNAGAIIRAAEAFGASGAVFLKGSVNPYNPKCLRSAAGSTFRLPLAAAADEATLVNAAEQRGLILFAAVPAGAPAVSDTYLTAPCLLLIGSEAHGIRPSLASRATPISIPTAGVESLNAAVAAGILLYEARRQRGRA